MIFRAYGVASVLVVVRSLVVGSLVVSGLAAPVEARIRDVDVHEPLPQATMAVPAAADGPVAPVQATMPDLALETPASPAPDDALAAPLSNPENATVSTTPADPLFVPGSSYPVIIDQPAPAASAASTAAPRRFQFRRKALANATAKKP